MSHSDGHKNSPQGPTGEELCATGADEEGAETQGGKTMVTIDSDSGS